MIAKLKGNIDSINDDSTIIIDVNGVGYMVFVSSKLIENIHVGDYVDIKTMHIFKQDQQYLCGFQNSEELTIFKALLDVPGIGVKSAMSIISSLSIQEIAVGIATQDSSILCRVNGIGKKTASRILLELKDKSLTKLTIDPQNNNNLNNNNNIYNDQNVNDAILGLVSLGYQKSHVIRVINDIMKNNDYKNIQTNELIVLGLKNINS